MQTHNFPLLKDEVTFDCVQNLVRKLRVFGANPIKCFETVHKS